MTAQIKAATFPILINDTKFGIPDPVPTGRQLLDAAGKRPVEEHVIFQLLTNGLMEQISLDETIDLRKPGIEKFMTFRTDALYRIFVDGHEFNWGAPLITGLTLKKLAQIDPAEYCKFGVWLERRKEEDLPVGDNDTIDLTQKGIERFFTGVTQTKEG